jgi:hypothetical protein
MSWLREPKKEGINPFSRLPYQTILHKLWDHKIPALLDGIQNTNSILKIVVCVHIYYELLGAVVFCPLNLKSMKSSYA